jgi:hypothetical protein
MQTRRFIRLSGMVLAAMLTLLVGSVRADGSKLEGTWDVILKWPEATCTRTACIGGCHASRKAPAGKIALQGCPGGTASGRATGEGWSGPESHVALALRRIG